MQRFQDQHPSQPWPVLRRWARAVPTGLATFALLASTWPGGVVAQTRDEAIQEGARLAKDLCAACHAVDREGESPEPDAPPFRIFASLWPLHHLEEALAEGIMVGHPSSEMPVFQFTTNEIAQLIAYMESIQTNPDAE
ncbi:MAG: c-type cytochrome [Alphaproteobacteria bacterium]